MSDEDLIGYVFDLLDPDDRAEQRELVRAAVDRLPDLLRQVVILAYFQGLKYRDVADALDIPVGTVKSRLHAALARLTADWTAAQEESGNRDQESGLQIPLA